MNGNSSRGPESSIGTRASQTAYAAPFASPPAVDLHIEELVLHGFAASARYRIAQAVEREMARLIAEGGIPPALTRGGEIASLDGGAFEVAAGAAPETVGAQVARAILGRLTE